MQGFFIFYAPFLVLIAAIISGFWVSLMDTPIVRNR